MSFTDAIKTCLQRKYADFKGRARRSEYWFFFLFTVIVSAIGAVLDAVLGFRSDTTGSGPIQGILNLALLIPGIAVAARRLHDTGRSGWWQLIGLIPIVGWIILIVFLVQDSKEDNKHGPNPKGLSQGQGVGYGEAPPQQQY